MSALVRDYLASKEAEIVLLEPEKYDEAIVGLTDNDELAPILCYSTNKLIEILMRDEGMSPAEAWDYFYHNISGSFSPDTMCFIEQIPGHHGPH